MYTYLKNLANKMAGDTANVQVPATPGPYNPRGFTVRITPAHYVSAVIEILTADGKPTGHQDYAHSLDPVVVRKQSQELIEEYNRMLDFDGESLSVVPPGTYNPHGASIKVTGNLHVKAAIELFHADGKTSHSSVYTHSHDPKVITEIAREFVEDYNKAMDFGPTRAQAIPAGTYNPRGVTVQAEATIHVALKLSILEDGKDTGFSEYTYSYNESVVQRKAAELVEKYNRLKEIESN